MVCQCKFIDCNKCTPVVWDVDSGGGCAYSVGAVDLGNSLYFLLTFAVNLKLLQFSPITLKTDHDNKKLMLLINILQGPL